MNPIPNSKPHIPKHAMENIAQALLSGKLSGDGQWCKKVERRMREDFALPNVMLTSACTHALELAAILLNASAGDEVIMPSFTFVSTANAFIRRGMKPVFADIDEKTLNISPESVKKKISPRTRAIVPVHYAGVASDMDALLNIAKAHDIFVIEDAAHAIGAKYKGKPLGAIGDIGCFSFHDTKNICAGEGGAICMNDAALVLRAEILREKGTNRSQFIRGEIDKYTWVDVGGSYIMSEILAAFLDAQFDVFDFIQGRRKAAHDFYMDTLRECEEKELLRLPIIPDECESNWHLFYILLPTETKRDMVMKQLKAAGISAPFHYVPLHTSPFGIKYGNKPGDLPVTENLSARLLRLPLFPDLSLVECEFIVTKLKEALK